MKTFYSIVSLCIAFLLGASAAWATELTIQMNSVTPEGVGAKIGTVTAHETPYGTLFTPKLTGLSPGLHGFHVHSGNSCNATEKNGKMVAGLAAGGHFDPEGTNAHKGPYENGHLGDLPPLYVDASGAATVPVLSPRLHASDLKGHALMIHQNGDNFSDTPKALGGGGARVACGIGE